MTVEQTKIDCWVGEKVPYPEESTQQPGQLLLNLSWDSTYIHVFINRQESEKNVLLRQPYGLVTIFNADERDFSQISPIGLWGLHPFSFRKSRMSHPILITNTVKKCAETDILPYLLTT